MKKGLDAFLSSAAIKEHKEYLERQRLKASIWNKSGYKTDESPMDGTKYKRMNFSEREELSRLLHDIKMHEVYFESFRQSYMPCPPICRFFGSENNFAYELSRFALGLRSGFACVILDRYGRISICDDRRLPSGTEVRLALDVCEHAYFRDYGFKKDKYVRAAIAHLDLSRLATEREG